MKGSVMDVVYILSAMLTFALCIVLGYILVSNFVGTELDVSPPGGGTGMFTWATTAYSDTFDNVFILLLVGLSIGAVLFSTQVSSNPGYFIIDVILILVIILMGGMLTNVWFNIAADSNVATAAAAFPKITYVMLNLPLYAFVISLLISIAFYGKGRGSGDYGGGLGV